MAVTASLRLMILHDAVSELKPGKHDRHFGMSSGHVSNACDELFVHITILYIICTCGRPTRL